MKNSQLSRKPIPSREGLLAMIERNSADRDISPLGLKLIEMARELQARYQPATANHASPHGT
jgi:hypothetical protein